jgi:nucleoside-diphosphate-sugar epimerase
MSQSIFLTGGTGYVGGCFLNRLLDGLYPSGTITALTRSSEKAKLVETLSTDSVKIKALEGSFSDLDLLEKAAYEHDIIIEAGDSDNPDLVNALLKGIKKRFDEGKETTFIHVSGTGTLADDARGEFKTKDVSNLQFSTPPNPMSSDGLLD